MNHEHYMRIALDLAKAAEGQTGVNPVVGCVVVKAGRIVGMGAHLRAGTAHAEVHALKMAGSEAAGSTVYVTLEPCCHTGRTPPCSDRIIREKVARVVIAARDPNPVVNGGGIKRLREHGIEVICGVLEQEAIQLNEVFNKYVTTGLPFVTMKTACTLDGRIASGSGDSKWITGEAARERVHLLRHRHSGIMVGVNTLLRDNPRLSARLPVESLQPVRIIADSGLRTPSSAQALQGLDNGNRTVVLTAETAPGERQAALEAQGVQVLRAGPGPRVDLQAAMQQLAALGIASILLEGGGALNGAMLQEALVDKVMIFIAPKIIGGAGPGPMMFDGFDRMEEALGIGRHTVEVIGDDILITGYPEYTRKGM